jgi:hypothetical protein
MVDYVDYDAEGGPKTLTLSVSDAVKKMSESNRHFNLFKAEGVGGAGMNTFRSRPGTRPKIATVAKDAAAYREARKKGEIDNI